MSRSKIGIIFSYNENWIGGTYYILNLITSFKLLPDHKKPALLIYYRNMEDQGKLRETHYPYLFFKNINRPLGLKGRLINKLYRSFFTGKPPIAWKHKTKTLDAIFPNPVQGVFPSSSKNIFWIPDLQDLFYPEYFTSQEIEERQWFYNTIASSGAHVIFSSKTVLNDFELFFPAANVKKHVLNFAVSHPPYEHFDITSLKNKYGLDKRYFISPNQFWKHKNHKVIIDAVGYLKGQGKEIHVVFTGKENDHRNPEYTGDLKNYVIKKGLGNQVHFLGFINRNEQLQLMKHAISVIQPSLFEGWSTVVEDAKAMGQQIIVSDIPVHREQIRSAIFFDPHNSMELANHMNELLSCQVNIEPTNYIEKLKLFGEGFLNILGIVKNEIKSS